MCRLDREREGEGKRKDVKFSDRLYTPPIPVSPPPPTANSQIGSVWENAASTCVCASAYLRQRVRLKLDGDPSVCCLLVNLFTATPNLLPAAKFAPK